MLQAQHTINREQAEQLIAAMRKEVTTTQSYCERYQRERQTRERILSQIVPEHDVPAHVEDELRTA